MRLHRLGVLGVSVKSALLPPVCLALAWMMTCVASQPERTEVKPPPDSAELKLPALIVQLDDDKFQKREQATKELQQLGRSIIPQLEAARDRTASPEVRRRLERVLDWHRPRLEWFRDRAELVKRLNRRVRVVTFDDLDTSKEDAVSFAADRYARQLGIVITGEGGQFAGRTFGYAVHYPPVSGPNMYAPGPTARRDAASGAGGSRTDVTFAVGGKAAAVTAFAAVFIDADYPDIAASSLRAFDRKGKPLGEAKLVQGVNASQVFCGVIAVDGGGNLVPDIVRVHLVNGGNWPGIEAGEGVALDDFLFAEPVVIE